MQPKAPPEVIQGERVTLRKYTIELAEEMFATIDSDRKHLQEFLPWPEATQSIADSLEYIKTKLEQWEKLEFFDYGIFLKPAGAAPELYLGSIGIHGISWKNNRCEIGYWIAAKHEGKGFISEAVKGLEKALFHMGLNRIEICCNARNVRSAAVPRRCGYHLDGILRQDNIENGRYRDTMVFSKLRQEYV